MFTYLKKYFLDKTELTKGALDEIRHVHKPQKIRKGHYHYLLQQGEVCNHSCFMVKGCLRSYRLDESGDEHILNFAVEDWWINDDESYHTGKPAKSMIDALEDSEVILFLKSDFEHLLKKYPNLDKLTKRLVARSYDAGQDRIYSQISRGAEEKYRNFIFNYPDIFNRMPLHLIASYLGVSRETLSRIRSRAASAK